MVNYRPFSRKSQGKGSARLQKIPKIATNLRETLAFPNAFVLQ